MAKLTVFFLVIFLTLLSLLSFFNKASVNLTVWKGVTYEDIPIIALIFISAALGILSMFIIATIRDARRYIHSWQIQRKQKKESRIQESYSKGLEAFFVSRYEEARELFTRVIESDPSHLNALLRLGDIAFIEKDFVKAKDCYLKAEELKPRSIEVLLSLEKVSEAQQKWRETIQYLDSILKIDGENTNILYRKRDIYEKNRKWEELMEVQHKILKCKLSAEDEQEENKKLLGYKYELGRYYLETGSVDKAIKILKSVIKSDKDFIAAYLALAGAYFGGNNKEAQAILIKGYEETSSLVFLTSLEDHFITEGEPGTIIDIYQKAVQKDPKDLRLQFFLAKLYYRLEMIDYALDTINAIDPSAFDYPGLHALLGSVYERRSEYEKAVNEFRKSLKVEKMLLVPFCCSNCNYISNEWSGRCPECKSWNTFILDINEICKIRKRQGSA
ncbi:MAG TPA: tetratricopeptide repeat protein [Nitrospirae bacterium]|nr:tetratricopeptide repeat protein [Nitrospirota bacterium]HDH04254.1 tetratricopeptide repeat protein [Nitrospirota bacterium]